MYSDNEQEDDDDMKRKDIEFKLERFREQSQIYLKRLPILKQQLEEINRLHQFDSYVQKLNEIGKIVQNLSQNIRNIEQLHLQLNEKDRMKIEQQINQLRTAVDHEIIEFHQLREQTMTSTMNEDVTTTESIDENTNIEQESISNELRQRHVTVDRLNDSYEALEQDLRLLHETMIEVAQLVKHQNEKIALTQQLTEMAHDRIQEATSILENAVHNKYVTIASGAILGATLGGPVGFLMGMKVGALAALSGSAVGALSANLIQQRSLKNEQTKAMVNSYHQAML